LKICKNLEANKKYALDKVAILISKILASAEFNQHQKPEKNKNCGPENYRFNRLLSITH